MDAGRLKSTPDSVITARLHPSGFARCDSNFDSLSLASDGCVYYTLCSHNIDTHARVYRLDLTGAVSCLGDLGEITGEAGAKTIPQGKSHSPYFEHRGRLYLATHYGYYKPSSNKEEPGEAPPGYGPYPGGHFVAYDMANGEFEHLVQAPPGEGLLTMTMDADRGRLYGLTWPRGFFIYYDLAERKLVNLGQVSRGGELGDGEDYFCLCRSLGLHPQDGAVYFTNADGELKRYCYAQDRIETTRTSLRRDVFGHWDVHVPGHQGYNWRKVLWHEERRLFYAVQPKSGYLFSYDPEADRLSILERITADELRHDGGFEPFRYGYLSLAFGPDRETLYYLTGTPGLTAEDGRTVSEVLHLVTYDLRTGQYLDHGVVRLEDGRYPTMTQSLAVHPNGRIYTVPWLEGDAGAVRQDGRPRQQVDLISFRDPLARVG